MAIGEPSPTHRFCSQISDLRGQVTPGVRTSTFVWPSQARTSQCICDVPQASGNTWGRRPNAAAVPRKGRGTDAAMLRLVDCFSFFTSSKPSSKLTTSVGGRLLLNLLFRYVKRGGRSASNGLRNLVPFTGFSLGPTVEITDLERQGIALLLLPSGPSSLHTEMPFNHRRSSSLISAVAMCTQPDCAPPAFGAH